MALRHNFPAFAATWSRLHARHTPSPPHEAHTLRSNSHASHSPHLLPLGYLHIFSSASTAASRRELMAAAGPVKINVLPPPPPLLLLLPAAAGLAALRASLAFPPCSPAIEAAASPSSPSPSPSPPAAARCQGAGPRASRCPSGLDVVLRCCCCCCSTCGTAVRSSLVGPAGDFRLKEGAACCTGRRADRAASTAGLDMRPMCLRGGVREGGESNGIFTEVS
jgi:hypothetical protein